MVGGKAGLSIVFMKRDREDKWITVTAEYVTKPIFANMLLFYVRCISSSKNGFEVISRNLVTML